MNNEVPFEELRSIFNYLDIPLDSPVRELCGLAFPDAEGAAATLRCQLGRQVGDGWQIVGHGPDWATAIELAKHELNPRRCPLCGAARREKHGA